MSVKNSRIKTVVRESDCKVNHISNHSKESDKLCEVVSKESK